MNALFPSFSLDQECTSKATAAVEFLKDNLFIVQVHEVAGLYLLRQATLQFATKVAEPSAEVRSAFDQKDKNKMLPSR